MTRGPDEKDEPTPKGGKAAERLRQFLAARFGDDAPPIPPDEEEEEEEEQEQAETRAPSDAADETGSDRG